MGQVIFGRFLNTADLPSAAPAPQVQENQRPDPGVVPPTWGCSPCGLIWYVADPESRVAIPMQRGKWLDPEELYGRSKASSVGNRMKFRFKNSNI